MQLPSILARNEKTNSVSIFTFNHTTKKDVTKEKKYLDVSKASQENDICTKIIKEKLIFSQILYTRASIIWLIFSFFQTSLKEVEITPVLK